MNIISSSTKEMTTTITQGINSLREDALDKVFTRRKLFSKLESNQISPISNGDNVFCEMKPLNKQQIVKLLQSKDEIPVVTEDGV